LGRQQLSQWKNAFTSFRTSQNKDIEGFKTQRNGFEQKVKAQVSALESLASSIKSIPVPASKSLSDAADRLSKLVNDQVGRIKPFQNELLEFFKAAETNGVGGVDEKRRERIVAALAKYESDIQTLETDLDSVIKSLQY
jgi:uncharacterized phage infection (PIP) family protein YhgE